jgi:hypothetical protein
MIFLSKEGASPIHPCHIISMGIYRFVAINRPTPPGKRYWTLVRDPPFDELWDAPHFHIKADADKEADRLTAEDPKGQS